MPPLQVDKQSVYFSLPLIKRTPCGSGSVKTTRMDSFHNPCKAGLMPTMGESVCSKNQAPLMEAKLYDKKMFHILI